MPPKPTPTGPGSATEDAGDSPIERPAVLIVEDDRDVAATINDVVEERGYRAIRAENGREAPARLEKETPAL
ncbi:MAG: hypothetical protein ABUS79_15810, partial [Pseudomonadota bacterium]